MAIMLTTARARWRRPALLLATIAGTLAAMPLAAAPARASSCALDYWSVYDGSSAWQGGEVPQPLGYAFACTSFPSVTRTGTATQIALTDPTYGPSLWWNDDGSPYWTDNGCHALYYVNVAPNGVASTAGGSEIAFTGTDGSVWFLWKGGGVDNIGCQFESVAPAGSATGTPAIVNSAGGVEIAAMTPNGSLSFYWALNGTTTWHPEQASGPGTIYSNPVMAYANGATTIAAVASNGAVWLYWVTDGTATWHPEQVTGPGAAWVGSQPAIALSASQTEISYISRDGALWLTRAADGTTNWDLAQVAPPASVPLGSDPAMTRSAIGTEIAAVAPDGSLWFYWNLDSSPPYAWNPEQVTSSSGFPGTPSITYSDGLTVIAALR